MNLIETRVTVHLPHDAAGQTASPGQTITVDGDDPGIVGYLMAGFLVPLAPLDFPAALQPPAAPVPGDAEADALADAPSPETAAEGASAAHAELEAMTKDQLLTEFAPTGVTASNTKAEIIAAIEAQA